MAEGPYSAEERRQVEEMAREIVAGRIDFATAAEQMAAQMGRSARGLKLYLGRAVRKLNGGGQGRRARSAQGEAGPRARRRPSLERLVGTTRDKASELQGLRKEQEKINRRIEVLEAELKELQEELMRAIGLS